MADSQYSLPVAAMNNIVLPQSGSTSEAVGLAGVKGSLSQLSLDLNTVSLDIRRLAVAQGKLVEALTALNLGLSSQRSLLKAHTAGPATSSDSKSKLIAEVEQRSPTDRRKASMANESAMIDLAQVLSPGKGPSVDKHMLRDLDINNHKLASEVRIAPSGATSVQLAQVELAGARSGIGEGLDLTARKAALLEFARDTGTMASAFKIDVKEAGQIMADLRTSLNLGRTQSLDMGNAIHFLGNHLDAEAADIASVVQEGGEAGIASGLKPQQVAAFAGAMLNAGADKAGAGVALKGFGSALSNGDGGSVAQRAAWAELGLDPAKLASQLRTDAPTAITDVLKKLSAQPLDKQSSLATTLFGDDKAMLRLAKEPDHVLKAFSLVPDGGQYAKDEGSMAQAAEARGRSSQGRWNAHDASQTRLSAAVGEARAPIDDGLMVSMDTLTDQLSSLAEGSPKAAAGISLVAAAVGSLLGAVAGAVVSEALSRVGKKVLNQTATRLPSRLGDLIADVDGGDGKGSKVPRNAPLTPQASVAKTPGLGRRLVSTLAKAKPLAKAVAPLMVLSAGYDAYKGWRDGDDKAVGGAVGEMTGTVVGAAIGSLFLPVIGTAIGGVVGGIAGSWLGEELATPTDRLDAPGQVSRDLTSTQTANQPINFAPVIQISAPDPATAQQIATLVTQTLEAQFLPMMMTNPLAVRRNAALTDGVA